MKLFIASDIHGSAYYCRKMLEKYEESGADKLVLLGDILYHGPRNDLPRDYAPKEVIAMLNPRSAEIIAVRGNCDTEVDQMVLSFPVLQEQGLIFDGERRIYHIHGHKNLDALADLLAEGDLLFFGHTHVTSESIGKKGCRIINPGSVSIPKENTGHSYIVYENGEISRGRLE
jgi:putative phosphoesterase